MKMLVAFTLLAFTTNGAPPPRTDAQYWGTTQSVADGLTAARQMTGTPEGEPIRLRVKKGDQVPEELLRELKGCP